MMASIPTHLTFVQHQNVLTSALDLQSWRFNRGTSPTNFLFLSLINCSFSLCVFSLLPLIRNTFLILAGSCLITARKRNAKQSQEQLLTSGPHSPSHQSEPLEIPDSRRTKSWWYNSRGPAGPLILSYAAKIKGSTYISDCQSKKNSLWIVLKTWR